MNNTLEKQITNCKKLLTAFQDERQKIVNDEIADAGEILEGIKHKQKIVNLYDKHREQMRESINEEDEDDKEQLRTLGSLLERLLVIDQENERLLTKIMSTGGTREKQEKQTHKIRPALKSNLPLMARQSDIKLLEGRQRRKKMMDNFAGSEKYI
ncbi:MAG: hypothetical protein HRT89_13865 [Lentisphaeria bacterium]|nr:hypothetical protein [Lentisphaeria bacterium]NQZ69143.1 hypothetical protein [Lentisphaeria bacterium]